MKKKNIITKEEQHMEDLLKLWEQDYAEHADQEDGPADSNSGLRSLEDDYPNGLEDW